MKRATGALSGLTVAFLLACAMGTGSIPRAASGPMKEKFMALYSKIFADYQLSSFLPQATRFKGEQTWFSENMDPDGSRPSLILLSEKGLTVQYGRCLAQVSYAGAKLWDLGHDGGLKIFLSDRLIYYRSGACLYAVTLEKKEALHAFDVAASDELSSFYMVLPKGDGRFLMQTFNRAPEVVLGQPPQENEYALVLMGRADFEWIQQFKGRPLVALLTRDQQKVVLLKESENVAILDSEKGQMTASFELPRVAFLNASLDRNDNLVVVQKDGEGNFDLVNYALKGERVWSYRLPRSKDLSSWQPPGIDDQNRVYYIHNGVLCAVENGNLAWEFGVPRGKGPHYLTVLGDRTLLVSSKNMLFHLGPDGTVLLSKPFAEDEEIWTPPVVDNQGRVYVGTNKGIYCLQ